MARTLHCPHCGAEFDFAQWSQTASCPQCEQRVRFEDALAAGTETPSAQPDPVAVAAPGPAQAQTPASAVPAAPPPAAAAGPATAPVAPSPTPVLGERRVAEPSRPLHTLFGKPLVWSTGWTVIALVWLVAAGGLVAVRLDMGHLTVLSTREQAAIAAVEKGRFRDGVTYGRALAEVMKRFGHLGGQPRWYVQDRPWEHKVYVTWELDGLVMLSWTVTDAGAVDPGSETELFLKEVLRAAQPAPQPALP